jgi:hypothetical protein
VEAQSSLGNGVRWQRRVEANGEMLGAQRRGNEVRDGCGNEWRSSQCLFIGPGHKRKWWRHEWSAAVSAAFKSFGYNLRRGEDGAVASVLEGKGRRRSKWSSTQGRWMLEAGTAVACGRMVMAAALPRMEVGDGGVGHTRPGRPNG